MGTAKVESVERQVFGGPALGDPGVQQCPALFAQLVVDRPGAFARQAELRPLPWRRPGPRLPEVAPAPAPGGWGYRSFYQRTVARVGGHRRLTADGGRKLNVTGTVLVVPPELEQAARQLLNGGSRVIDAGGTPLSITNEWQGSAELVVTPFIDA